MGGGEGRDADVVLGVSSLCPLPFPPPPHLDGLEQLGPAVVRQHELVARQAEVELDEDKLPLGGRNDMFDHEGGEAYRRQSVE